MVWMYERGMETMTIETRFDNESTGFELIWHQADGSSRSERFATEEQFRARLAEVKAALAGERWAASGAPVILKDGWRLK